MAFLTWSVTPSCGRFGAGFLLAILGFWGTTIGAAGQRISEEVIFLNPTSEIPLQRKALAGVYRESFVLSATDTTAFEPAEWTSGSTLVFDYGLGGRLESENHQATLEVWDVERQRIANLPLSASPLHADRFWRRAAIPLKDPPGNLDLRVRTQGLSSSQANRLYVSCPHLVATPEADSKKPNILIIVCDTLRRDYVGFHRSKVVKTPAFDRLAEKAAIFEQAFTPIPITQPAHFSMLTGLYPAQTGLINNTMIPSFMQMTLPWILKGYGYRTGAVIGVYALHESYSLGRGFDFYKDIREIPRKFMPKTALAWAAQEPETPFFLLFNFDHPHTPRIPPGGAKHFRVTLNGGDSAEFSVSDYKDHRAPLYLRPGQNKINLTALPDSTLPENLRDKDVRRYKMAYAGMKPPRVETDSGLLPVRFEPEGTDYAFVDQATLTLDNPNADPLHAHLVFSAYRSMGPEVDAFRYGASVVEADRHVNELMDAFQSAGLLENTLVLFTADHGEGLSEHGVIGHVQGVYAEETRIPLAVSGPGVKPGRYGNLVSLVDVAPTLLEWLDIPYEGSVSGRSFAPLLTGDSQPSPRSWVFSASYPPESQVLRYALRNDSWSYIHQSKSEEFYRIGAGDLDWAEVGISDELEDGQKDELRKRLDEYVGALERSEQSAEFYRLSSEEQEKLRALGYLH